jgi:hypothetical protein
LIPFRNPIGREISGEPVGHATTGFSQCFGTVSANLLRKLGPSLATARQPTDAELALVDRAERCTELHGPGGLAIRPRVDDFM